MKTCKLCQRDLDETDFGTQRYCRTCWPDYLRRRRQIHRSAIDVQMRLDYIAKNHPHLLADAKRQLLGEDVPE